jgi:hypothetical protein
MIRSLLLAGCMALALVGMTQTAEARLSPSQSDTLKKQEFKFTGTLPQIVNTKLALSELSPKDRKKIDVKPDSSRSSCSSEKCDVVIVHPGGVPMGIRILGFALNFIPFAVGSWVVGDALGSYLGGGLQIAGVAMIVVGFLMSIADPIGAATIMTIGWIMASIGYVIPLVTVWFFQNQRYRLRRRRRYYRRRYRRRRRRYYRRRYRRRHPEGFMKSGSMARAFPQAKSHSVGFSF